MLEEIQEAVALAECIDEWAAGDGDYDGEGYDPELVRRNDGR